MTKHQIKKSLNRPSTSDETKTHEAKKGEEISLATPQKKTFKGLETL
jgi:hypothetical protein